MEARFGPFRFDFETGSLYRNEHPTRFQDQPAKVLEALLEARGEIVSREELRNRIWSQDTFVDFDGSLNTAIRKVRYALRDDAESPIYIETVPRQGYRFVAPIAWAEPERAEGEKPEAEREEQQMPIAVVPASPPPARQATRHNWTLYGMVGLIVLAAAALWFFEQNRTPAKTARLSIPLPAGHVLQEGFGHTLTISDDGQLIGFIARQGSQVPRLWLRRLSEAEPKVVPDTENLMYAQLSPDGTQVLMVRGRRLFLMELDKGVQRMLAELGTGIPLSALWGKDGYIYFAAPEVAGSKDQPSCLWRTRPEGGTPELLLKGHAPNPMPEYILPVMVVDRDRLLISTFRYTERTIEVFSISRRERQTFYGPGSGGLWLPSGWLLFHDGDHLQAVAAQLDPLRTSASPVMAIRNVKRASWSGGNVAYASNGTLLYEPMPKLVGERQLVWVDLEGKETPVGISPGSLEVAHLAADGQGVLLRRFDAEEGRWSLWAMDLRGGPWRQITKGAEYRPSGVIRQKSASILYTSHDSRLAMLGLQEKSIVEYPGPDTKYRQAPVVDLPDGGTLFCQGYMPGRGQDIVRWRPGHEFETLLPGENAPALSPDGRWLLSRGMNARILLRPYPELGQPIVVAARSAHAPLWSPDGKRIYYRDLEHMVAVDFQPGPKPRVGEARNLFADGYVAPDLWNRQYAIHPDGKRFLMVKKDPTADVTSSLNLILNWPATLGR